MANSNVSQSFHALFNSVKRELGIVTTKPPKKLKFKCKVYPTESQCRLLDSCGYRDFKDPPFFPDSYECNNFVLRFVELKTEFMNRNVGKKPCKGSQKILLELFAIDFHDKEDMMDKAMANRILRSQVIGGLAPFQMFEFYSTFSLKDPSIWGDLSYEDAHRLLESLREKKKDAIHEAAKDVPKDPPLATSTPSNSRPLSGRPPKTSKSN